MSNAEDAPPDWAGLDALVADGTIPGYAVALRRGDEVTGAAAGVADLETRRPFTAHTVHRVASLSKPVAALVTMQQAEAGALSLEDPVTRWLPELADLRVLTAPDAPLSATEPLRRPVLVRHLLTMTSGFGVLRDETALSRAMAEAGVHPGPAPPARTTAEVLEVLATLPLAFQPGDGWAYHTSTDVLSVLLERAAGRGLDEVVDSGVREPLGLQVLAFSAPEPAAVATGYDPEPDGMTPTEPWGLHAPPPFLTLSAGLFTTAPDYLRVLEELVRPTTVQPASTELSAPRTWTPPRYERPVTSSRRATPTGSRCQSPSATTSTALGGAASAGAVAAAASPWPTRQPIAPGCSSPTGSSAGRRGHRRSGRSSRPCTDELDPRALESPPCFGWV